MFFFSVNNRFSHDEDRPGEAESLPAEYIHKNLKIVDLDGKEIFLEVKAPANGWTIEAICSVELPDWELTGADAYLDDLWLTSTEV